MNLPKTLSTLSIGAAIVASMGQSNSQASTLEQETKNMTSNIPMSNFDILDSEGFYGQRKPTNVEKLAFPRDQRKRRKNNRRAFAAGVKNDFKK